MFVRCHARQGLIQFQRIDVNEGGWIFTEEMLQRLPWAKVVAKGPDYPMNNLYKLCCLICRVNAYMRARGVYVIKKAYQSPHN